MSWKDETCESCEFNVDDTWRRHPPKFKKNTHKYPEINFQIDYSRAPDSGLNPLTFPPACGELEHCKK